MKMNTIRFLLGFAVLNGALIASPGLAAKGPQSDVWLAVQSYDQLGAVELESSSSWAFGFQSRINDWAFWLFDAQHYEFDSGFESLEFAQNSFGTGGYWPITEWLNWHGSLSFQHTQVFEGDRLWGQGGWNEDTTSGYRAITGLRASFINRFEVDFQARYADLGELAGIFNPGEEDFLSTRLNLTMRLTDGFYFNAAFDRVFVSNGEDEDSAVFGFSYRF